MAFIVHFILSLKRHYLVLSGLVLFMLFPSYNLSAQVVKVNVKGLKGDAKKNVLALLDIAHEKNELSEERIRALYNLGFKQIKQALQPFGYFRPHIKGTLSRNSTEKDVWTALYEVSPGQRVKVASFRLDITGPGKNDPLFKVTPPFKPGDAFLQEPYELFKSRLLELSHGNGYLDGAFKKSKVFVNPEAGIADIEMIFDTGPRYVFGEVSIGSTGLSPTFLKRYADFRQGEPFDGKKLISFRKRLLDTNYFKSVDLSIKKIKDSEGARVLVSVNGKLKRPNVYRLGLGYVSDIGPRVSLDWKRRYLGTKGHHARIKMKLSTEEDLISGEYFIPLERPYMDYISFSPEIEHFDTDSRIGWKYSARFLYSSGLSGGWRRNIGFDFGYEDYRAGGDNDRTGEIVPFVSLQKTVADNVLNISLGYMMKIELRGEIEGFIAKTSYLSSTFRGKYIRRISDNYRFLTRLDLGAIATNDISLVPSSVRFYAGGYSTIRGFSLEELGPVDKKEGKVVGGRFLAVGSLEIERHLYKQLSGALFFDVGNSFDPDYSNKIEMGAGVGIRIKSPVGPVRLDFAFGISRHDVPFKFYLTLGPEL